MKKFVVMFLFLFLSSCAAHTDAPMPPSKDQKPRPVLGAI